MKHFKNRRRVKQVRRFYRDHQEGFEVAKLALASGGVVMYLFAVYVGAVALADVVCMF